MPLQTLSIKLNRMAVIGTQRGVHYRLYFRGHWTPFCVFVEHEKHVYEWKHVKCPEIEKGGLKL